MTRWSAVRLVVVFILALAALPSSARAQGASENVDQVKASNDLVDSLLAIHNHWARVRNITKTTRMGGYHRFPNFYREVEHRDAKTGLVISRVKWEREIPENIHSIDVFFHDDKGRVIVDYTATFLTDFRNAPIQALVNLHQYDGDLWAFRQFNPIGERLFERCEGTHFGETLSIWLDEGDIISPPEDLNQDAYTACFGYLPTEAGRYLNPETLVPGLNKTAKKQDFTDSNQVERRLADVTMQITVSPKNAELYLDRANAFFLLQRFDEAIADYTQAIRLDDGLDKAYFGRGMALGRAQRLDEGIRDLSVFIERHPENSVAYTKRGVRHIWNNDFVNAEKDLSKAIKLDENNAEAHDDLGVVLAQTGRLEAAVSHFIKARAIDPSYQKVHHNLALSYFIMGDLDRALRAVDDSLALDPDTKSSLLLKGEILDGMGKADKARAVREKAEFLPDTGNWSERSSIR